MFTDYIPRFISENDIRLQTKSLIIVGIVILFFTQFRFHLVNVLALSILVYYILNLYLQREYTSVGDFNSQTRYKLEKIQLNMNNWIKSKLDRASGMGLNEEDIKRQYELGKLAFLYLDVNFIHFLDNIEYLYKQNPGGYISIIKGINNILKLRNDSQIIVANREGPLREFEKRQMYYNYEETEKLAKIVNNHFHSFIYTMPKSSISYQHHTTLMARLSSLLFQSIGIQRYYYQKTASRPESISTSSKFLPNPHVHTKPYIPPSSQFEYLI
jgi:hypothetical protein